MKQSETKKLLSMIRAQYQHKFIIDDMTELVWHGLLNDGPALPAEAVYKAAMTWMRDNEWPPQVRDLRDIIASEVSGVPNAEEAWASLWKWLKAGYPGMPDNRPPLPDMIRASVKEIGGTSLVRELGDKAHDRFVNAYNRRRREYMAVTPIRDTADGPALGDGGLRRLGKGVA